jgi:hypothetical protein
MHQTRRNARLNIFAGKSRKAEKNSNVECYGAISRVLLTRLALVCPRHSSDRVCHLALLIDDHVMGATNRQSVEMPSQILLVIESHGFCWVHCEEL